MMLEPFSKERSARGGRGGGAKQRRLLTDDQVREIRASKEARSCLAQRFGVSAQLIGKVQRQENYKDVR